MDFIFFAILGYALMAIVAVLDKGIVSKSLSANAYAFYSTFFFFGAFLFLPFAEPMSSWGMYLASISALGFGCGTWLMMICLSYRGATHVIPFIGGATAISAFVLSSIFLREALSFQQLIGISVLIVACLIFSYERGEEGKGRSRESFNVFFWSMLSGLCFGISHVATKPIYTEYSFVTGLVWAKGLIGIVALVILLYPSVRKEIFGKKKPGHKSPLGLVFVDKVLAIGGTLSIQYAFALGSVAIVSGLVGIQYALTLILVMALTVFAPKVFHEYFTKKEIIAEVIAIVLTTVGIFLLI